MYYQLLSMKRFLVGQKFSKALKIGIENHLHQNPTSNSLLPERIRLFFTNFPLVSVF